MKNFVFFLIIFCSCESFSQKNDKKKSKDCYDASIQTISDVLMSAKNIEDRNLKVYENYKGKLSAKAKDSIDKIINLSNSINEYIKSVEEKLADIAGVDDNGKIINMCEVEKIENYIIGIEKNTGEGYILQKKVNHYVVQLRDISENGNKSNVKLELLCLDYMSIFKDDLKKDYVYRQFKGANAVQAMSVLANLRLQIASYESYAIQQMIIETLK
ncbi:MAG: hypothetical protein MUC49_19650 [Raineya sp.]|jgi:hypothetical protein|nr:hypothetical protein [Raineya sp.]